MIRNSIFPTKAGAIVLGISYISCISCLSLFTMSPVNAQVMHIAKCEKDGVVEYRMLKDNQSDKSCGKVEIYVDKTDRVERTSVKESASSGGSISSSSGSILTSFDTSAQKQRIRDTKKLELLAAELEGENSELDKINKLIASGPNKEEIPRLIDKRIITLANIDSIKKEITKAGGVSESRSVPVTQRDTPKEGSGISSIGNTSAPTVASSASNPKVATVVPAKPVEKANDKPSSTSALQATGNAAIDAIKSVVAGKRDTSAKTAFREPSSGNGKINDTGSINLDAKALVSDFFSK